jgi:hypothetical protein
MTLAERLQAMIAEHEAMRAAMRADKPNVTDGHSDGKRVRYVRHEEAEATLRAVLAMLAEDGDQMPDIMAEAIRTGRSPGEIEAGRL